ncbi:MULTISPECIES: FxSxx-COOH system tetratricopeptide repeat protein [Cyanophyceae]|uniref:FxSxx-COOH system tetratricopeptide repeat protein n=1 Tax=Cyanophyceae TaxID=3028117 RepID=UPI0016845302|nr:MULTISPECIES: FxSxx-COOH system tetratricopeptide repeat protein [Cyanophyceae]MBD1917716.1 tetratricopeptide repeat protein [Phormidium sp. FACHB-77]MBD2032835.1 tetratricopeptide repeat protein [Phormidium sp. FACHB-322]MBD2051582.1 tetratricopeptide repeat protein [Leptolyngbya sp. FACHB-60]
MPYPRLTLFQTLSALPAPQFEQLRFTLNPPPGIVPEGVAAQGNRVAALLSWVEGATGCGLEHLYEVMEQLCPGLVDGEGKGDKDDGKEPPWMVPYGRNPYFTGRNEVLTTLYQQLHEGRTAAISQTQAISGLGGIGKTQTAVEYAYRYRDDYRYVFWVHADTALDLTNSYVAIAQTLDLPLKNAENQDETVQSVRVWLSREEGWLLIFDNADRPELVQPFLPREIKGHILVTSRAQDFQDLGIVQPLEMETLSPQEAIAFLLTRTGRIAPDQQSPEYQAATDLAAELGYLPLALEQAAAYMVTNRVPFAAYLASYRKQRLKRLEKAKPKLGNYPDSIATTWALNLKEVQKTAPAAAALLNYCAFLHPDGIPFALFTQGAAALGEPLATALADAADDPLELYDLLDPLCRYSLIRVEPESQSLSLHRLVQEVIRAELGEARCQTWVEPLFRAMGRLMPAKGKGAEYQDWPTLALLVNPVQELANHCQQREIASTDAADVFHAMGKYLLQRGQYALADPLLQKALELRQRLLKDEHEDIASSVDRCAASHSLQGRYSDAEILFKKAIAMRKRLLGEELWTASSINGLAESYRLSSRFSEAEELYKEALLIRRRHHKAPHKHISETLNNLALLCTDSGRLEEADPLYMEAIEIDKAVCGERSLEFSTDIHNLSLLRAHQKRFEEAENLCIKALEIKKILLGRKHPLIADGLNVLGSIYLDQGRFEEAEEVLLDTLNLDKELLGQEHPNVAISLNQLAILYNNQKRYSEAEPFYLEALALRKRLLGNKHPLVAKSLNNLAMLYQKQGRYGEAQPLLLEAINLWRQSLGSDHPNLASGLNNLARCYRETFDYDRAEALCQEALAIAQKALPENHELKGRFLDDFATLRAAQGHPEEARSLYQQALAILEPKLGAEHPWTVRCRENLGKLD